MRDAFLLGRAYGERTFVVYSDERASYEAFARAALAVAAALREAGVGKGDRVAIAMRNLPEWPVAFFGCLLAGGVATLLNAWWTGPELEYGLLDSGAKVAIVDRERLGRLAEHLHNCPELKRLFVSREGEEVAHPKIAKLEAVIGEVNAWKRLPDRPLPDVALDPDDDATILYTSGTTGKPKGAVGCHRGTAVFAGANFPAPRRTGPRARPQGPAKVLPAADPAVPYDRLPRRDDPAHRRRRQARVHAQMGPGAGAADHRTRAHYRHRRRADHRLAVARPSRAREVRPLLAREHRLRRSAGGGRAGAQAEGEIPEVGARFRLGDDRDLRRSHRALGTKITNCGRKAAVPRSRSAR